MDFKIGSKYEEKVIQLKQAIRKEEIKIRLQKATNHACYFCSQHIERVMAVLAEPHSIEGIPGESKYYLDLPCCQSNRIYLN